MEHLNRVNVTMQESYVNAMGNMDERVQALRRQDEQVAEHLQREVHAFRSEAAANMVELEAKAQGDQFAMAKEYQKLTNELHEQAMVNMGLRAKVSESEFAAASMGEHLRVVKSEQANASSKDRMMVAALREEHHDLRSRLGDSEERHEDAMRRGQEVQQRLQHVEDTARQNLPTMHEELNELRRMLKNQEDKNMRMKSEYEMSRQLPQPVSVQTSSMPTSSRATEHGWDFLSSDRVAAFPIGAEVRSPEIVTPSHRSPANRDRSIFRPSACFAPDGPASSSSQTTNRDRSIFGPPACFAPDGPASSSSQTTVGRISDARAVRDEQLKDLLKTLGMEKRSSSSSSNAVKVDEGSDERTSDAVIAKIVEDDVKQADLAASPLCPIN